MALDRVLEPIVVNGLTIKNRVARTAHGTNIGQGRVNDDLIAYHEARARGGVGLTILEAASVHRTDTGTLRLHDDGCVADFRRLMSRVEPTGMRVFAQLGHLGHDGVPMDEGQPPWSASEVRSPAYGWTAHAMTVGEIAELVDCFARAAAWARAGGLHGVEVHAGHGYLLQQFLSPVTNHRDDRYGGSFDNRLRFTLEVVRAVREAVGPDFVVGVRTGADATDDGLQADDCADIVRALTDTGLIDYVNVTYGSCRRPHKIIGAMHEPVGYELPFSEVVTKATPLPTLVTGRFRTLVEADRVISDGIADLVGMTRAHIADPEIVQKTVAGSPDRVRPCLACNQGCLGGFSMGRLACTVNADVGFERERVGAYEPAAVARSIVVVGGGPAGLEAARVAAVRGHRVVLCEADQDLGGNMRFSRRFPFREVIGDSVDWLAAEVRRLGVDVRTGTRVDVESLRRLGPDAVIVATGSRPRTGAGQRSSSEIAALAVPPPGVRRALVIDRFGGYEVLGVSELLVQWDVDVTVVTPHRALAPRIQSELVLTPTLERLARGPGAFTVQTSVDDTGALPEADLVVVIDKESTPVPLDGLEGVDVHVVGDAADPGNLWAAIRTGNAAGRTV